jgi:hypothetical protein
MPIFADKSQVAIKLEAVPGTAETLTNTEVVLTTDIPTYEATPDVIERNATSASHDSRGVVIGKRSAKISFKMWIRGLSAASGGGNPNDFGAALRACSVTVAYSGTTPNEIATYTPNSSALDYATIAIYRDGKRYMIHGAQGNCVLTFRTGAPTLAEFTFTGIYNAPTTAALLTPTYSAIVEPPFLSASLSILGFGTAKIDSLTLDLGNEVVIRPYPNTTTGIFTAQIVSRKPKFTIDPEEEVVATKDFWAEFIAGTLGSITTGLFPSNGTNYNQFTFTMPNAQYSGLKLDARDGIAIVGIEGIPRANASAGDDSWSLVST